MNNTDKIRFTRRAEIDRKAAEIKAREIRINRENLGIFKAIQHATKIAADWQREQYNKIESELDD